MRFAIDPDLPYATLHLRSLVMIPETLLCGPIKQILHALKPLWLLLMDKQVKGTLPNGCSLVKTLKSEAWG